MFWLRTASFYLPFTRVLTLIVFFQFSGLNNGYAYVQVTQSMNIPNAFSMVGLFSNNWMSSLKDGTIPLAQLSSNHALKTVKGLKSFSRSLCTISFILSKILKKGISEPRTLFSSKGREKILSFLQKVSMTFHSSQLQYKSGLASSQYSSSSDINSFSFNSYFQIYIKPHSLALAKSKEFISSKILPFKTRRVLKKPHIPYRGNWNEKYYKITHFMRFLLAHSLSKDGSDPAHRFAHYMYKAPKRNSLGFFFL